MSDKTAILFDAAGNPVLVRNSVLMEEASAVAEPEVDPEGGEPQEDETVPTMSVKPDDVSWDEWSRRQSFVRSMAREFDELDQGDIREFLKGKVNRELGDEEIDQLRHDIAAHRVGDLADVFDNQLRSTVEQMKRGRRTVRVSAPRGWTRRAFKQLDQGGVERLCALLISRGHDSNTIKDKVVSRVADEGTREAIVAKMDNNDLKVEG